MPSLWFPINENVLPYGDEFVNAKSKTIDEAYIEALDIYIGAEILLAGKDPVRFLAKVKKWKRDLNNLPIGDANPNTILKTRIYELELPGGRVEE